MEAELTGTSERRGGGSGDDYGERQRGWCSAIAGEGEGDEGERGEECREVLGVSVALGWGQEAAGGGSIGGRGCAHRRHASAYWQRWVTTGTSQVGWASTGEAQVGFSLSLYSVSVSYFISLF